MGRQVKCQSCGKSYDYDRNEICPRCGAYTNPGQVQTELEEEMLRSSGYECSPDCMPSGYGGHDHRQTRSGGIFASALRRRAPASRRATERKMRQEDAEAATGARDPELADPVVVSVRSRKMLALVVIILVLAAAAVTAAVVLHSGAKMTPEPPQDEAQEFYILSAGLGQAFDAYPFRVRVEASEILTAEELGTYLPAGNICLLVDVYVECTGEEGKDSTNAPYLRFYMPWYDEIRYAEPIATCSEKDLIERLERIGYTPIDAHYWDNAPGQLVFILPEGAEEFFFCAETQEHDRAGWFAVGVTEVALQPERLGETGEETLSEDPETPQEGELYETIWPDIAGGEEAQL